MNLRALSRKYLGWCPGYEEASLFFQKMEIVFPTGYGVGIILFTLLASLGIHKFSKSYGTGS